MNTSQNQNQPETRESVPPADSDIHSVLNIDSQSQITHFDDDVPPQVADAPDQPQVKEQSDPFPDQALVNFLERPRVVHSFKWLSSSAAGSCLARICFPDALFSCPTVWNKIQQYVYMHAGLHFTVRANGTPFHYGQLIVAWRPACQARTVFTGTGTSLGVYDNFYAVAQYPHMLVSPSSAQVTELSVPYESPLQQLPIRTFSENDNELRKIASLGFLEFWVLNPLRGQGATNSEPPVTVSLFAHFTEPKLTGFTHAQLSYVSVPYTAPASAPVPTGMRYSVSIAQAKSEKVLPFPLNTPLVKNPEPLPVAFIPAKTSSTKNLSPSLSLALNEVSVKPIKATKISDHLKIWSLLQQYSVATTADLNSVIASFYVHPGNCATGTFNSTAVQFQTKLSYIANLFNLWRGPIEYRFDFIASKFHSCRIKIAWYPPKTTEVATNDELPDAWTQIVDVQGQVSVVFTVPWLQSTSWLTQDSPNGIRSSNGIIVITLLNSLSYPTPNGPSIHVNCWIRAPNIEFAAYTKQNTLYTSCFVGSGHTGVIEFPMFSDSLPSTAEAVAAPASSKKTKVTQALDSSISPVDLDSLPQKPSFMGILTPKGKIWITPPLPEPLASSVKAQRSVRLNTLLDYLSLLHLGFTGSTRLAVLNPHTDILFVPRLGEGSGIEHTFKSTTTFAKRIQDAAYTASSYFPSSANSIKDVTLPNYSTLAYRPTMLEGYRIAQSFSYSLPGVDIYNFSDQSSPVTLAGADDFSFVGMAPAPLTW